MIASVKRCTSRFAPATNFGYVSNDLVTSNVIRPTASTIVNQECYNLRTDLRVITK